MHKLVKITKEHYIIMDDSEIKEGDYYLRYNQSIMKCTSIKLQFNEALNKEETIISSDGCGDPYERSKHFLKKITHSTEPLELLSENGLSGMGFSKVKPLNIFNVKELIGEVDVNKKAEQEYREYPNNPKEHPEWHYNKDIHCYKKRKAFIKGYKRCLEDNKDKKYTEEDISKALSWGYHTAKDEANGIRSSGYGTRFIQSLQPKTEWEIEMIDDKLKLK